MAEKDKYADELLSDEQLDQVAGGSLQLSEKDAKKCGITLLKEDGSPGEFTWYYNFGDYYWNYRKISDKEAYDIVEFTEQNGRQPNSLREVKEFKSRIRKIV